MTATERVFQALPEEFSRQDILKKGKEFGLAYSTAQSLPAKLLYQERAERIGPGEYQKTND